MWTKSRSHDGATKLCVTIKGVKLKVSRSRDSAPWQVSAAFRGVLIHPDDHFQENRSCDLDAAKRAAISGGRLAVERRVILARDELVDALRMAEAWGVEVDE